jgi:hypothetical protein
MLVTFRNLKQRYLDKTEFRKYALFALGEMALLIIGILIALQVDNWNSERLQTEAVKNYLQTIARNIASDLKSVDEIRSGREDAYELSVRWLNFGSRASSYSVPEVSFASRVLNQASLLRHFNASTSGYEALKSSGALEEIQGTDIERLLYDYYDTVARIKDKEQDHNNFTRLKATEVYLGWPDGLDVWELNDPQVLIDTRFQALQPAYRELLQDFMTRELMVGSQNVGPLMREYDTLNRTGRAFIQLVEADSMEVDESTSSILNGIYDPGSGIGYPELIVDGRISWQSYYPINSDANDPRVSYEAGAAGRQSPYNYNSFVRSGDSLHIDYQGGAAWAGIWLAAGAGDLQQQSRDFSTYSTLLLELKGDTGGETINVNMEDRDDPADGTSTRIKLQLSDQWQTYEIDLTRFETADLRILLTPLGFVFFEEPVAFSVRTARFVRVD